MKSEALKRVHGPSRCSGIVPREALPTETYRMDPSLRSISYIFKPYNSASTDETDEEVDVRQFKAICLQDTFTQTDSIDFFRDENTVTMTEKRTCKCTEQRSFPGLNEKARKLLEERQVIEVFLEKKESARVSRSLELK